MQREGDVYVQLVPFYALDDNRFSIRPFQAFTSRERHSLYDYGVAGAHTIASPLVRLSVLE